MIYNTHDTYIGQSLDTYGEWTWAEIEVTQQYAHGLVIDIGANIGTHTLAYARTADRVVSMEPQYIVFQTLMANLALNCLENVIPHFGACGSYDGKVPIHRPDYSVDGTFGCVTVGEGQQLVSMSRLDSFGFHPDFIKIDAEGSEIDIIHGGMDTIRRAKPVMYIENDREEKRDELIALVESLGYSCQWHKPNLYNPDNYYHHAENIFPYTCSENILCLPDRGKGI